MLSTIGKIGSIYVSSILLITLLAGKSSATVESASSNLPEGDERHAELKEQAKRAADEIRKELYEKREAALAQATREKLSREEAKRASDEAKIFAGARFKVFHCLGVRFKKHENGIKSLLAAADALNRFFEVKKSNPMALKALEDLLHECKTVIKIRDKDFSSLTGAKETEALFKATQLNRDIHPQTHALLTEYFNGTLFCGDRTHTGAWAGAIVGAGAGFYRRTCIDPLGGAYKITSPFLEASFATLGFGIGKSLKPEHEIYRHVKRYRHFVSGFGKDHSFHVAAALGVGAHQDGNEGGADIKPETGYDVGVGLGALEMAGRFGLNIKTRAFFGQHDAEKIMKTIDAFLEKGHSLRPIFDPINKDRMAEQINY